MYSVALLSEDSSVCRIFREEMEWYNCLLEKPLFLLTVFADKNQWIRGMGKAGMILLIVEISDREDLEILKRNHLADRDCILIYDGSISPEEMVAPEIRPLFLIKKPFGRELVHPLIRELCFYLIRKGDRDNFAHRFICRDKTRRLVFPFSSIYYFETRNKRVVLATAEKEYEFYDSFSRMESNLPEEFVRCHRSYIVNLAYLTCVDFAHLQIVLDQKILIPVSKKYRRQVERVYAQGRYRNNMIYGTNSDRDHVRDK